jgi:hypothetical protein
LKRLAVAAALAASGCVLLALDPDDFSTDCRFEGDDNECGTCMIESCRSEINACCADTLCNVTMKYTVDECVPRRACPGLARSESTAGSRRTADETFKACVTRSCASLCGIE